MHRDPRPEIAAGPRRTSCRRRRAPSRPAPAACRHRQPRETKPRLYLNDGKGSFRDATATRLPKDTGFTDALAAGDLDGDGDQDLVFGSGRTTRLYLNDGKGSFRDVTATHLPGLGGVTMDIALGDVDGDRNVDVVLAVAGQNRLFLNDGMARFRDATGSLPRSGAHSSSASLGDVDGDGDLDVFFGNFLARSALYANDGKGSFTDVTSARLPSFGSVTLSSALADVDRDGDLDLVAGCAGRNRLLVNDGKGRFADATIARMPESSRESWSLAVGDVDGDGDRDLIFGNVGPNDLYTNDGTGHFRATSHLPNDTFESYALALGDVDADGDPDIVVGNAAELVSGPQRNFLYRNLRRHVHTPAPAAVGQPFAVRLHARAVNGRGHLALPLLATAEKLTRLPPLGTLGLDPARMIALAPLSIPRGRGDVTVTIAMPNDRRLAGETVFAQALVLDPIGTGGFTNVTADPIR